MDASTLPLDIWWLLCEELTNRQDVYDLYMFSRTNRTMANLALPNLYSIHELVKGASDATKESNKHLAIRLRSIILSSIGKTAFPYCLWIRSLRLGDIIDILGSMHMGSDLWTEFFTEDMAPFLILQKTTSKTTRRTQPRLDIQSIVDKVGETITLFVKEVADRDNRVVALTQLEGHFIPMHLLPAWTSRLATLTTLHIQDGSVIGEQVALSIRENCPKFRELTCYFCDGPTVDEDLAAFFKTLRPNSLEVFSVSSRNRLGGEAFSALLLHANSLKELHLSSLQTSAFRHLGILSPCVNLLSLLLEGDRAVDIDWASEYAASFSDVVSWLSVCVSLKDLRIRNVPCATSLIKDVLKSPYIRLAKLDLMLTDAEDGFYSALGSQTDLEEFLFRSTDEELDSPSPQHAQFIRSICRYKRLTVLDIMQTILFVEDLDIISSSLGRLEELSFDGDLLEDSTLQSLTSMRRLKNISIGASTMFTVGGILQYINSVKKMGLPWGEFYLNIMNQMREMFITADEHRFLISQVEPIGGKVDISHPEEEHESDFSE